jgi:glyoxylase-like metal-dependent hydrolase (beta-lactamase superfamily II)
VLRGELERGEWIAPREALRRWEDADALLHTPALHVLRTLADGAPDPLSRLNDPPHLDAFVARRIELQRGVHLLPLLTPTLPPARHTTCYLVGDGEMLVVDPGSPDPEEQARLEALARELESEGRRFIAVVLTHHHPDHVSGARAFAAAFGLPIWAHRATAERFEGVERCLEDGEEIALAGDLPMTLVALHTPGHAPGHLCLFEPRSRALLCGDMLSGASTIIVDPPEGDMEVYLASLLRLAALGPRVLHPAHGETMPDGPARIAQALEHRRWREEKILEILGEGPLPLAELTRRAYQDVPPIALSFAERSALASLLWLGRRGRAACSEGRWKASL